MSTGGDIIEITWNNEIEGSGTFYCKSGEDSTFEPGGYRTEDDDTGVDGGGNPIYKMINKRWSFEAPIAWDMQVANELDVLAKLHASVVETDFTIASINGTIWGGKGKPVGDLPGNGGSSTIPLKLQGGKKLKKI